MAARRRHIEPRNEMAASAATRDGAMKWRPAPPHGTVLCKWRREAAIYGKCVLCEDGLDGEARLGVGDCLICFRDRVLLDELRENPLQASVLLEELDVCL